MTEPMPDGGIDAYLEGLGRDDRYVVDEVLKETPYETTQKVRYVDEGGMVEGPFVRKYIRHDAGIGHAYEEIHRAQLAGRRFAHVPRVVDYYSRGHDFAVVLEYAAGETLQDVVYRCDPSWALACDLFPRLCEAVMEIHESFDPPIIHRDLKPSNVVLCADSLSIIDFGIARRYRADAEEDTYRFGTRAYAPPEQYGFGQTDVRSDVYALGMILYYCLTERTPTNAVRAGGFVDKAIPEFVRPVLVKATALDPDRRYSSARELRDAFLETCAQAGCSARSDACVRDGVGSAVDRTAGSEDGRARRRSQRASSALGGLTSRVPSVGSLACRLGIDAWREKRSLRFLHGAWTFLVLACLAVWVGTSVACAFDPYANDLSKRMPAWVVSVMYLLAGFGIGLPLAWALLDRAAIRERFPWLPRALFEGALKKCAQFFLACLAAFFVLSVAFS